MMATMVDAREFVEISQRESKATNVGLITKCEKLLLNDN